MLIPSSYTPAMLTQTKKITSRVRSWPSDLIQDVTLSHFNSLERAMSFSTLGEIWPATEQNSAQTWCFSVLLQGKGSPGSCVREFNIIPASDKQLPGNRASSTCSLHRLVESTCVLKVRHSHSGNEKITSSLLTPISLPCLPTSQKSISVSSIERWFQPLKPLLNI